MFRSLLAAGLLFALILSTSLADAQDASVDQARANFQRGVELYNTADYAGALAAFQEAYRIRPHPTVRVNIANCYDHLGRPVEAIFHFEHYLSESGRNAQPQQRRDVEQALTALRQRIAQVNLHVSPDGATVRIDDAEERRAPVLDPVTLTAGTHRIVVSMNGFRTDTRIVEITGGRSTELDVNLERGASTTVATNPNPTIATGPAPEPRTQAEIRTDSPSLPPVSESREELPPDEEPSSGMHMTTATWVVGGVSAGAIVIACITGAMASSANSDFDSDVARANNTSLSESERNAAIRAGHSDASRASTLATVTDVLGIAGAIGIGAAVTMFILSGNDHPDQQQAHIMAVPAFSHDSAGVAVRGSF